MREALAAPVSYAAGRPTCAEDVMHPWVRQVAVLVLALAALLGVPAPTQAVPQVFLTGDVPIASAPLPPAQPLPVLFVHGHRTDEEHALEHYRTTWQSDRGTLRSFAAALAHAQNAGLGIEPYYIHFLDQDRSIADDAREIGEAVELILARHDPGYVLTDPARRTSVQVVIIAFSKGTISARLYLKSLVVDQSAEWGLPAPRMDYRPVSEFIAIAPPNHGVTVPVATTLSVRQLNNGYGGTFCVPFNVPEAADFIQRLNDHPIVDSHISAPAATYVEEAPGSRADGTPPHAGVLYVALYADGNRDPVGGDTPQDDCAVPLGGPQQGRKLARNMAPQAQNRTFTTTEIPDTEIEAHRNSPHAAAVMCVALYAAVHHRMPAGVPCSEVDGIPVVPVPPRATVALVLDLSGSMLAPACPTGCTSRLSVLKEAAELFVQLWSLVGVPQDAIGATYFRTSVTTLPLPNSAAFGPLGTTAATVITDLRNLQTTAASLTAMGGGLQSAINALAPEASQRHVVLFTDGMQNVFPRVTMTGGQLAISGSGTPQSNVPAATPPTVLDTMLGIRVSVIGVGAGQSFVGLLEDIATNTDGRAHFTTTPDEDLRLFFIQTLISVLRGFSPQLVAYRRGTLAAATASEAFSISTGARKVVLKLSWRAGQKLTFRALRNGVDVTGLGTIVDGPFYRLVAFDPARLPAVRAGGTWTIRVLGAAGQAYEAAAIVDDTRLRLTPGLGARARRVGDAMDLSMRVIADGKALRGGTVRATVLVPGAGIGTLLATKPVPDDGKTGYTEPGLTIAQRRIEALLLDKAARTALRPVAHRLTLRDGGDGVYRGSFRGLTVPGIYTVVFEADGDRTAVGTLRRVERLTTLVRFGAADRSTSALAVQTLADSSSHREHVLRVRPRDRHGNFLGPGEAGEIRVALSAGTVGKEVMDLGDGGYAVPILTPAGADPTVTVTIAGAPLYHGALSALARVK
jgi:hypothetical protein